MRNKTTSPTAQSPLLYAFNKPFNTLCQFSGEAQDSTLANFIPIKDIYPAGRLDKDSEGLLLLTNDGKLQQQISHPKFKLSKTYWVQVEGKIDSSALAQLKSGIVLKDGKTKPAQVNVLSTDKVNSTIWPRTPPIRERKNIPTSWIALTIREGKNRQVRRMTAATGFPTLRLIRVQIGNWCLDNLQPGEYREISSITV
ncbi:pseudouridine synthase [Aliikangiella maris]|uniref:Pseudouridine synthase n=2 Tax=Aliikangiella maris TaxID=3162458 RepID=A0ABV3MIS8_9GAMM